MPVNPFLVNRCHARSLRTVIWGGTLAVLGMGGAPMAFAVPARQVEPPTLPTPVQARAAWEAATDLEVPRGVYLRIVRRFYPTMTLAEVVGRERAIEAFPDHPDHRALRAERRRIEAGYEEQVAALWADGHQNWRWSQTIPDSVVLWSDVTVTPTRQWWMTADALNVLQPGSAPPPSKNIAQFESDVLQHLQVILCGNLGLGVHAGASPAEFQPEATGLRMTVSAPTGLRTEYLFVQGSATSGPEVSDTDRDYFSCVR